MTATFFRRGLGRSRNAARAEADARMPLTRAKRAVAAEHACTQTAAAAALQLLHGGEWHHTGKFAAKTAYYDTADDRLGGVIAQVIAHGGPLGFAAHLAARRQRAADFAVQQRQFGRGGWRYTVGRIAALAARRAKERDIAEQALGRRLSGPCPLDPWFALVAVDTEDRSTQGRVAAARAAGWSTDTIALALANGGWRAEEIREALGEVTGV